MNIDTSISSIYASAYASSIYSFGSYSQDTTSVSTSNFASSTTKLELSSEGQMMSRVGGGGGQGNPPPDFESMSTDEFRDHLLDVRSTMEADGIDVSSMANIEEMTDLELESLKNEMMESAPPKPEGPPPPRPEEGTDTSSMISNSKAESILSLFEAMQEESDEEASLLETLLANDEEEETMTNSFLTN